MKQISKTKAKNMIKKSNGSFFSVRFIKKNRSDIRYLLKKEESCLILQAVLRHLIESDPQLVDEALIRIINIQASDPTIGDQAFVQRLIHDFGLLLGQ